MRLNERSLVVLIAAGLLVAAAIAIAVVALSGGDDGGGGSASGDGFEFDGNAAAALEGGEDEILMLSGTTIVRQAVQSPEQEVVKNVKTQSVYAAPGSPWVAYVRSAAPSEDFQELPELVLYDTESGDKARYGTGVAPVWNRAGTHVAFLKPVEPRNCIVEECSGDVTIGVVEAATGDRIELLEPGTYGILGWAGGHVLVSDFARPDVIVAVGLDGESTDLDFPATQYWDASPDGRWLVKTNDKKTEFVAFEDGRLGDDRVAVELGDLQLLQGSWSHDATTVAAVVSAGPDDSSVVTFSPEDPEPVQVEESQGATGGVLWSVDNESVLFGRLLDPKQALMQAVWCPVGNRGDCRSVISWTEGIALLRAE